MSNKYEMLIRFYHKNRDLHVSIHNAVGKYVDIVVDDVLVGIDIVGVGMVGDSADESDDDDLCQFHVLNLYSSDALKKNITIQSNL